jgi:uncharacterized protein (TIGR03086 family)
MTDDPIALFAAAAVQASRLVNGVTADRLADPTPCEQWDVRALINHMVTGNLLFASLVEGGERPDRSADHLGDDHVAAFRDSVHRVSRAFAAGDVLSGTFPTPFGPAPGVRLVMMRFNELVVHGWDVAAATDRTATLDPGLAEASLAEFETAPVLPRGEGAPFGAALPPPPDAGPVERLAAFLGRKV